jgi:hypothetical protein
MPQRRTLRIMAPGSLRGAVCRTAARAAPNARHVLLPALILLAGLASDASRASAQQLRFSETAWVDLSLFVDLWAEASRVDGPDAPRTDTEYFVNLTRLAARGQIAPGVGFLVATGGQRNLGSFEIWDAVAFLELAPSLTVDAGRVLLPFVRHAQQFTVGLQTHDFQRTAFLYPRGSTLRRRDEGVRIRGLLGGETVDYRVAITRGLDTGLGVPRLTGRMGMNGGRAEPGYVFPGTYLGGRPVLTAGIAFDLQPDVLEGGGTYRALGADAFWSVPVGEHRATGQAALVHYRGLNGPGADGRPAVLDRSGVGAVFDAGYLAGTAGPVVALEWFRPQGVAGFDDQLLAAHLGLNWWLRGTAAGVKLHGGLRKERGATLGEADPVVTLQLQTRFPFPARPLPTTSSGGRP